MSTNTKQTHCVTVRRIVREDIVLIIEADTEEQAKELALAQATNEQDWDCYDCEYFID